MHKAHAIAPGSQGRAERQALPRGAAVRRVLRGDIRPAACWRYARTLSQWLSQFHAPTTVLLPGTAGVLKNLAVLGPGQHLCQPCKNKLAASELEGLTDEDLFGDPAGAATPAPGSQTSEGLARAATPTPTNAHSNSSSPAPQDPTNKRTGPLAFVHNVQDLAKKARLEKQARLAATTIQLAGSTVSDNNTAVLI